MTKSIIELVAQREEILKGGNNWKDYDDKRCKEESAKQTVVEDAIEKAPMITDAHKLAAAAILLEANDRPDFADDFKTRVYGRWH